MAMFAAAGLAMAMKPAEMVADKGPRIDLEAMIPLQFGDWKLDESIIPLKISPDVQAKLNRIYNQTLARTYINGRGQRIMLSIAYGGDQRDGMGIHRPETCYQSQGFQVSTPSNAALTAIGGMNVERLVAQRGARIEPITYWIVVGDKVATSGLTAKLAQLSYGLRGKVPDGMLTRVSSLGNDANVQFGLQEKFVADLVSAVSPINKSRLTGNTVDLASL